MNGDGTTTGRREVRLRLLRIDWEGPLSLKDVRDNKKDRTRDRGLYQIYAQHPVFGGNVLVYVGRTGTARDKGKVATQRTFSARLNEHWKDWLQHEGESDVAVRLGRINPEFYTDDEDWAALLIDAERLTVYWNGPPYNSSLLKNLHVTQDLLIINRGGLGDILRECTNEFADTKGRRDLPIRPDDEDEDSPATV